MAETTKGTPRYRFGEATLNVVGLNALMVILGWIPALDERSWWWITLRLLIVLAFTAVLVAWLGYVVRDKRRGYRDTIEEATSTTGAAGS